MILEGKKLTKQYNTMNNPAVNELDIAIEDHTITVIVGESGSGKTTLLYMLSGLLSPTSGEVLYNGTSLYKKKRKELSEFRRCEEGFIFQHFNLIEDLNVYDNIVLPIVSSKEKEDKEYIAKLIEKMGLEEKVHSLPNQLSGGQQQRVAVARALANKPKLVFCDEPTGNLDLKNTKEVIELLLMIKEQFNATIVIVTHDLSLCEIADRIITLCDGKIIKDEKGFMEEEK